MASKKKLIDAQDAVRLLRGKCVAKYPNSFLMGLLAAASEIEGMPEAEPVKHGQWEEQDYNWSEAWKCSACGEEWCFEYDPTEPTSRVNYCPNCGAKMDLED